ncbi:unnamed protein product [Dicrocoelium dendriticum]|nr:unnamed protein product [Dicrocoelium dendriticum]
MCRCTSVLSQSVIDKVSLFSQVPSTHVIQVVDCDDLYEVPILLDKQGICDLLLKHFCLTPKPVIEVPVLAKWKALTRRLKQASQNISVAIVGKYTKLDDAYLSLIKALRHAAIYADCRVNIRLVCCENLENQVRLLSPDQYHQAWLTVSSCDAVVVAGGFGPRGLEGKLEAIRFCRERGVPFLGLCLGLQCAVIEFSRNVLGLTDANSTEFDAHCKFPVVIEMPEFNPGHMGGTMRLGRRRTSFYLTDTAVDYLNRNYSCADIPVSGCGDGPGPLRTDSVVHRLINAPFFDARHRHRYEVNPEFVNTLETAGLAVVGRDSDVGNRMEVIELFRPLPHGTTVSQLENCFPPPAKLDIQMPKQSPVRHPFFVATQFHPEYTSRPAHPSPFFVGLVLAACGKLEQHLQRPFRLSPTMLLGELSTYSSSSQLQEGGTANSPNTEKRPSADQLVDEVNAKLNLSTRNLAHSEFSSRRQRISELLMQRVFRILWRATGRISSTQSYRDVCFHMYFCQICTQSNTFLPSIQTY